MRDAPPALARWTLGAATLIPEGALTLFLVSAAFFFSLPAARAAALRKHQYSPMYPPSLEILRPIDRATTHRCASRTSGFWFLFARMLERSAPTIPRWCLTVLRERFFATSSVTPFLLTRRNTTVHAILRGFFRWRKSDSSLEVTNRNVLESDLM